MTAFTAFQRATCLIADGNREAAAKTLARGIAHIDRTGKDADMRDDLEALRVSVAS